MFEIEHSKEAVGVDSFQAFLATLITVLYIFIQNKLVKFIDLLDWNMLFTHLEHSCSCWIYSGRKMSLCTAAAVYQLCVNAIKGTANNEQNST